MSVPDKKWFDKKRGPYIKWWLLSSALFGILLSSIIVSSYFMYSNIYQTLDYARSIIILNSSLAVNSVNMDTYHQALQMLKTKEKLSIIPTSIRDIFSYGPVTASSTSSAIKK